MNLIKNISLLFCLSFLFAGNITELYKVDGMHCQYGCANKVQAMVSKLDGIKKCEVDFESSLMTVEYYKNMINSESFLSVIADNTTYKTEKVNNKDDLNKKSFWDRLKKVFG